MFFFCLLQISNYNNKVLYVPDIAKKWSLAREAFLATQDTERVVDVNVLDLIYTFLHKSDDARCQEHEQWLKNEVQEYIDLKNNELSSQKKKENRHNKTSQIAQ